MFGYINKLIDKLKKSEKGQGMVEYALVLAAVALIAAFVLSDSDDGLRGAIGDAFGNAKTQIDSATSAVKS